MKIKSILQINTMISISMVILISLVIFWTEEQKNMEKKEEIIADTIVKGMIELRSLTFEYSMYHGERAREQWLLKYGSEAKLLSEIEFKKPEEQAILVRMRKNLEGINSIFLELSTAHEKQVSDGTDLAVHQEIEDRLVARLLLQSQMIVSDAFDLSEFSTMQQEAVHRQSVLLIISIILILSALYIAVSILLVRSIVGPLAKLQKSAEIIGSGDIDHRVDIRSYDEIDRLSDAFNHMTQKLNERTRELTQVMDKVQASAQYARSIIEVSLDPLVTISSEGKITDVNKATELATGISRNKLIGSDFSDYFTEPEKARNGYRQVFEKGFVRDYPLAIRHVSGKITDVLYNASVYKDSSGNVAGVFAAARDITERKQAEEALQESEKKFRNLVESVPLGISITTPEGKIIEVNSTVLKIFGHSKEDFEKLPASTFYYDQKDRERFMEELRKNGYIADFEARFKRTDSSVFWGSITTAVQKTADGKTQFLNTLMDITERKRMEEARSKLAYIVEYSDDAIIGKTIDGKIFSWNPGAEKLYGYSANEVLGKPISILIPPDHFNEMPDILERIKHGETIEHYEAVRSRKDGQLIDVAMTASPIKDADGRITGASTIAHDITAHKKLEKQLHEASIYARNLIETSLDPLVTISKDGKITDVNTATESVTGISREKLIGTDFSNYFTEPEKAREGYQQVFEKGFVRDYPLAIRHVSGKITDVLYNASVYKDSSGNAAGVFAAARDITERKQIEEARTKIIAIIESIPNAVMMSNVDGNLIYTNKASSTLLGIIRDEVIVPFSYSGLSVEEIERLHFRRKIDDFFEIDEHRYDVIMSELFEKSVSVFETNMIQIDGKKIPGLLFLILHKSKDELISGISFIGIDITERKLAEEALQHAHDELEIRVKERTSELALANEALKAEIIERKKAEENLTKSLREKEVLIKEVHHRVKNNLQIVSSILHLQSTDMKDSEAIAAFKEGRNRVNTMALIHEKLYHSKDLAKINFAEYIGELTTSLFFFYGVNPDVIKLKIYLVDVFFDVNTAIPCGLIINELVSNSLKYAFPDGRKGEINIELHPGVENKFVLVVRDNGVGMPEDLDLNNIRTLGLKLVQSLTKQLDGTIELDRSAGTGFKITFSELKYKEKVQHGW